MHLACKATFHSCVAAFQDSSLLIFSSYAGSPAICIAFCIRGVITCRLFPLSKFARSLSVLKYTVYDPKVVSASSSKVRLLVTREVGRIDTAQQVALYCVEIHGCGWRAPMLFFIAPTFIISCQLQSLSISFVHAPTKVSPRSLALQRILGARVWHGGSHPLTGAVTSSLGVNDWGVTSSGESSSPLTPADL